LPIITRYNSLLVSAPDTKAGINKLLAIYLEGFVPTPAFTAYVTVWLTSSISHPQFSSFINDPEILPCQFEPSILEATSVGSLLSQLVNTREKAETPPMRAIVEIGSNVLSKVLLFIQHIISQQTKKKKRNIFIYINIFLKSS
jgi:hypothetical protein